MSHIRPSAPDCGLASRIGFAHSFLGSVGGTSPADFPEAVGEAVRNGRIDLRQAVALVYLVVLARYPSLKEADGADYALRVSTVDELSRGLLQSEEHRELRNCGVRFDLVWPEADKLHCDISHTFVYAHLSGIQRVVRSLLRGFLEGGMPTEFVVFRNSELRPSYLTVSEKRAFTDWEKKFGQASPHSKAEKFMRTLRLLPFYLRRSYREGLHPLFDTIRLCIRVILNPRSPVGRPVDRLMTALKNLVEKHLVFEPLYHRPNNSPLEPLPETLAVPVFLGDARLCLPEVAFENARIGWYLSLKRLNPRLRLSMILYDFIPAWFPEYVVATKAYLDYMRLLRVMDGISCISHDIERQARLVLECIRPLDVPQTTTHELPGSLSVLEGLSPRTSEKPLVLCVGTLEIRKNALSVLRAAVSLMRQGHSFRIVFAGNPGWRAEKFLNEFEQCKAEGFDVQVMYSVPEKRLAELYTEAAFTVYCSHAEGFGLPIVESLRYGKPVLVSDRGCMRDIAIKLGGCLRVNPENLADIEDGMKRLLTDPILRANLSSEIRLESWPTWQDYARSLYEFAACQVSPALDPPPPTV